MRTATLKWNLLHSRKPGYRLYLEKECVCLSSNLGETMSVYEGKTNLFCVKNSPKVCSMFRKNGKKKKNPKENKTKYPNLLLLGSEYPFSSQHSGKL